MANNPNDLPDAAAWGQFRAQLAQAGWKQTDINTAYGEQVNGRIWREISDDGIQFLRNAPKGTQSRAIVEQRQGDGLNPAIIRLSGEWTPAEQVSVRIVITDGMGGVTESEKVFTPQGLLNATQAANLLSQIIDTSLLYNAVSPGPEVRVWPESVNHTLELRAIVRSV